MRRGGFIRIATALTVAVAVLAATGASASASTQRPRMRAFTPRLLPSIALPAGLARRMTHELPHAAAPLSLDSIELFADPQAVTVNGITYQMYLDAYTEPAAFDQPPQLDVQLDRTTASRGAFVGEQDHLYDYAPLTGLTLTADAGLTHAHLQTGTSIDPSAIDMRFHATDVEQTSCHLITGGRGTFQYATGTLSASTFKIATGTVPFFGNITTSPVTATVVHDPGCGSIIFGAASTAAAHATANLNAARADLFQEPCTGPTLAESNLTGFWLSQLGIHRGRLFQLGQTSTNPFGPGASHFAIGIGSGTDMGLIVHSADGIHEAVRTKGVPFMGGSSMFRSTARPHVSPGHSCVFERHTYHYTNVRYQGTLTPAGSPLAILFDTGAATIGEVHATLWVPRYAKR
ncbi:MAG TPA: hypothetical protein VFW14_02380 [Gaiellales bacterium]|nr:hypothetical protein [Gaiellales bacterium]